MNKTELVNTIAENAGLSKVDARKALDAALEAISDALKNDEKVKLVGFGTFTTGVRAAYQGMDPRNGAPVSVAEKRVVKFKAGLDII